MLREPAGGRQNLPRGPPLGCLLSLWVVSPDAEVQVDPAALLLHLVNLALAIRLAASLEREQLQRVVYRKRPPEFCMFSRGGSRDGCAPVAAVDSPAPTRKSCQVGPGAVGRPVGHHPSPAIPAGRQPPEPLGSPWRWDSERTGAVNVR